MLPGGWLFPGQDPINHLTRRQLNRAFHAAKDAAEIDKPATLHTLRHCFATHLMEAGYDLRRIQILMGHKSLRTTTVYLHLAADAIRKVPSPLDLLKTDDDEQEQDTQS